MLNFLICYSASPLDLVLGCPVVQHQSVVAVLQVSRHVVQLLIHLGMLVVHRPQEVHLLGEVLERQKMPEKSKYR